MKNKDNRILRKRKRKLAKRLERKQWANQKRPMFAARNIEYEMAQRTRAIDCVSARPALKPLLLLACIIRVDGNHPCPVERNCCGINGCFSGSIFFRLHGVYSSGRLTGS